MTNKINISISDIATQLNVFKILAISLPAFYRKTGISAKFAIGYSEKENGLEIDFAFHPKEPNREEYNILLEDILDAEKLMGNESVLSMATKVENINQLVFKLKEEMKVIIEKQKRTL